MRFEDPKRGATEINRPEDTYDPGYDEAEEVDVDALIESGRRAYHEAWWDYVSEFN